MMLKTVYGPPPADMERIEAAEAEEEDCIREEEPAGTPAASSVKQTRKRKGVEGQ